MFKRQAQFAKRVIDADQFDGALAPDMCELVASVLTVVGREGERTAELRAQSHVKDTS